MHLPGSVITELHETAEFSERFEEWMAYYEGKGINAVSAGVITLRRTDRHANWFRADEAPAKMIGPAGDAIVRGFEINDFLESVRDDAALLETRLLLSQDIILERKLKPSQEGWQDSAFTMSLNRGFAYSGEIDQYVADILIACNGQRRLADVLESLPALPGTRRKLKETFCAVIRRLINMGFLFPNIPGTDSYCLKQNFSQLLSVL